MWWCPPPLRVTPARPQSCPTARPLPTAAPDLPECISSPARPALVKTSTKANRAMHPANSVVWFPKFSSTPLHPGKMETPDAIKPSVQIRGKDLVGAVKVMPMGLDAAIKKRTSGEFKMEQQTGGKMNFSQNNETTSFQSQTQNRQLESFKEESNESMGFNQISSSSIQSASSMQSKSSIHSSSINSSSSQQVSSSKQFSSSAVSMSSQQKTESSKAVTSSLSDMFQQDIQHVSESKVVHNQEIQQDALKTQIVSAISDLEGDRDNLSFQCILLDFLIVNNFAFRHMLNILLKHI
jgi:hypothetical protein